MVNFGSFKLDPQLQGNDAGSLLSNTAFSANPADWQGLHPHQGNGNPNTYQASRFKPTNYLLWEPDERAPFWFNDGSSYPSEGFSDRHNLGGTLGAIGGHVAFLKYPVWQKLLAAPGPNDFYYSPASATGR